MKGRAFLAILALLCIVCSCGDNIGDDYVSSTRNETDNSVLLELSADISKKEVKMLGILGLVTNMVCASMVLFIQKQMMYRSCLAVDVFIVL